ncbi:copper chaperone for superoxide dismutase, chloroplastic/cytosolic-like isoform X2 [Punica granatum]|uniref:Superoxide dismutase copper chaperone n=1 Tax=Punica granatum TaxID=22663 RepID=A0A6P8C4R4_PUNGR|nr:copper chaperone for superoxide dismutase, chloroplastic/cytosolic-like isoform X2 [Punica granatum]
MAFPLLRAVPNTSAAIAASSIPATFAFSSSYFSSSSSPSSNSFRFAKTHLSSFTNPPRAPRHFHLVQSFAQSPSALPMEAPTSQQTEFMVDMKCEGCVNSVKNKLLTVDGVKNIESDLTNQVVRVLGTSPVKVLTEALEQTGCRARLIGQGVPEDFLISAAVVEFKGPDIFGVVRFAQLNMELVRIEANFSGLSPGAHGWSINEFGDLTRGAASTGDVFNPEAEGTMETFLCCHIGHVTHLLVMFEAKVVPLSMRPNKVHRIGDLETLEADKKGEAFFSGVKKNLRVADLIGRSVVLYRTEDKSEAGIEAAVIARSAGVGENYKKLCTCDGTIIWESSSNDFVTANV